MCSGPYYAKFLALFTITRIIQHDIDLVIQTPRTLEISETVVKKPHYKEKQQLCKLIFCAEFNLGLEVFAWFAWFIDIFSGVMVTCYIMYLTPYQPSVIKISLIGIVPSFRYNLTNDVD